MVTTKLCSLQNNIGDVIIIFVPVHLSIGCVYNALLEVAGGLVVEYSAIEQPNLETNPRSVFLLGVAFSGLVVFSAVKSPNWAKALQAQNWISLTYRCFSFQVVALRSCVKTQWWCYCCVCVTSLTPGLTVCLQLSLKGNLSNMNHKPPSPH